MIGRGLHNLGSRLERLAWDTSDRPLRFPPVFIIGAPRSGSTLLYQALVTRFQFGYISNLHHRLHLCPALAERLLWISRWPRGDCFESMEGRTDGWTGPSESWRFWYRFFRSEPQFVPLEAVEPNRMREMRGALRALGNAVKRPVLIKNMQCALRLAPLVRYVPEARFLVTHRDLLDTARSLLNTRKRLHGDYAQWWSMEPPDIEALRQLPPHQQVVEQVRSINRLIMDARSGQCAALFHDVRYESLCASVDETMQAVRQFLASQHISLKDRGKVPARFNTSDGAAVDKAELRRLERYVDETTTHPGHG